MAIAATTTTTTMAMTMMRPVDMRALRGWPPLASPIVQCAATGLIPSAMGLAFTSRWQQHPARMIARKARHWRSLMTNDRSAKELRRDESRDRRRAEETQRAASKEEGKRKPSKIERREWRGAGVCGDRHTD